METKQIWVLVLGALAIALVTSIISANITGNVIKLKADKFGKYQVYTKQEVDSFNKEIDNTITRIYTMLDKRLTIDFLDKKCGLVLSSGQNSCHQICLNKGNLSCMIGQVFVEYRTNTSTTNSLDSIIGCTDDPINEFVKDPEVDISPNQLTDIDMACICCEL
ncbi:MAG: hypothetical protein AABX07_03070 [Nanoarchaeota archaeon]